MGEGTGDGIDAAVLPASSPHRSVQRSVEMGIIRRDGQEFHPRGEGEISPCRRGSGRPPTMVGRPRAGYWITRPQTPYATTHRGGPLGKFGSPGMMGADDGQVPPCRDETNLTPHPPPPHTTSLLGGYT